MGPWIMYLFANVALVYFAYLALAKPQIVVGWLGTRFRQRLDRQFRYRLWARVAGVIAIGALVGMNWLFLRFVV